MITKFKIFEEIQLDVAELDDLKLDLRLPQVGSKILDYDIINNKVIIYSDEFKPNHLYDFVVLRDGTLLIGKMHYKLSNKSKLIKSAGELKIDETGKICYLNNQSGHYKPSARNLENITKKFKELNILHIKAEIDILY